MGWINTNWIHSDAKSQLSTFISIHIAQIKFKKHLAVWIYTSSTHWIPILNCWDIVISYIFSMPCLKFIEDIWKLSYWKAYIYI